MSLRQFTLLLGAILPAVLAVPLIQQRNAIPGKYIVALYPATSDLDTHLAWVDEFRSGSLSARNTFGVENRYNINTWHAYSGEFDDATIEEIRNSPEVAYVTQDYEMFVHYPHRNSLSKRELTTQSGAEWGLAALSSRTPGATDYIYDTTAGQGTYAYVVDTGILLTHEEFEGRAIEGYSYFAGESGDGQGHGTHVAGTIGGKTYGVAKKANLVGVKVFQGASGSAAAVLAGFDWAVNDIVTKNRTALSVINMSLGGGKDEIWQRVVNAAYNAGVLAVVSAGNGDEFGNPLPADGQSPGDVATAITVGAVDRDWAPASFTNYGPGVDILAPGVDILSAGITSNTATSTKSGTSMACPHVAGLTLYLRALEGLSTPRQVTDRLLELATKDAITGELSGSPNLVAYNGNK